jgi:hypothetical protein
MHPDARIVGSKIPGWLLDVVQNKEIACELPGGRSIFLQLSTKAPPSAKFSRAVDDEAKSCTTEWARGGKTPTT